MRIKGSITFSIDGNVSAYLYQNKDRRDSLILSYNARILADKVCYYTIRPNDTFLPTKFKYPTLRAFVPFCVQRQIIDEYKPSSKSCGMSALSRRYNISRRDVSLIIGFNKD